jgi:uncharacterized DUF497 family protein
VTFAWDERKSSVNFRKHRVGFREAATVFDDPLSTTFPDEEHSDSERRFITIGLSALGRILVVAHIEVGGTIRLISAREVTSRERNYYEEN